ncbi:MAG: glycoside hydrolase family 65 protein [Planctomycetes bacterium]|nr:glycoside hydrolase family 65 protein [Planctomycetota bacterium]
MRRSADSWSITESAFNPATAKAAEGLFTLGNGLLHVRGSFEEHLTGCPQNDPYTRTPADVTSEQMPHPTSRWGTFVPGIYGTHPLLNTELINLPWFLGLMPIVDGEWLDMQQNRIRDYSRVLDLKRAVLTRTLTWHTRSGHVLRLSFERTISKADEQQRLCLQRVTIESDLPCTLQLRSAIDASVHTNGYDHFTSIGWAFDEPDTVVCSVRTDRDDTVTIASCHAVIGAACVLQPVSSVRCGGFVFHIDVTPKSRCSVEKRTAITTSRDPADRRSAADVVHHSAKYTYEQELQKHVAACQQHWDAADITIGTTEDCKRDDGDCDCQCVVRCSLFHLQRVHVPNDSRVAVDAKGYSGEAYWGRFFWDTEMFLLPYYVYTRPHLAATLTDFRINTLAAAMENAGRHGLPGACYPWESDHLGNECCPSPKYADHELHVTADVVYGLAHYAAATCTTAAEHAPFWSGAAGRVLVETARFWMQRTDASTGLCDVMGPDEYTPLCDNNAYTNHMVAFNLRLASQYGRAAGADQSECDAFAQRARELPILTHPDDLGLILQCDGFDKMLDPDFDLLWTDRSRTFASQVANEQVYASRCPKQADVLMLMAAFPRDFTDDQVRTAWEYYEPITTHDSSLSAGIHCIIACRLGLVEDAWKYWLKCSRLDLHEAAEGIHIANAGAVWQAIVFGFLGHQSALWADTLTLKPRLPKAWQHVAVPLVWRGQRVRIAVSSATLDGAYRLVIENRDGARALPIRILGREQAETVINAGGSWTIEGQVTEP